MPVYKARLPCRMKKINIFLLLIACSASLLFLQTFILKLLLEQEKESDDPAHQNDNWHFVEKVQSHATNIGVPLFVVDETIISKLTNLTEGFWSDSQQVFQLATIAHLSSQLNKEAFLDSMREEGFDVTVTSGIDPTLSRHNLQVQIPLHYLVQPSVSLPPLVHIVLFYERPAGHFWWHGPLPNKQLLLTHFTGAVSKVELVPAMLDGIKLFVPGNKRTLVDSQFIECDYALAKTFHQAHPRDESEVANMFRAKAWKLLAKAKDLLDELRIPFWLSSGTLLGFWRQCDFIPYSKDVDLGIRIQDYSPSIIHKFSTHNLPLTHWFGKVEDSLELSFLDNDIKLDIFFFYEEEDHVWNGGTQARTGKKFKYSFPKFELCRSEFLQLTVQVPCQTKDYIEANYGTTWMEPITVWDWKASPPNVQPNGEWPLSEWPQVIQLIPIPEQS